MQPEVERRTFGVVELRAPEQEADSGDGKKKSKMPKIEGYAALFNTKSEAIFGFREVIMPGAFDRALREAHDVRALVNHNPDKILGRTKAGTLRLSIDSRGLRAEIEPPDTTVGRDAVVSLERGDLSQMSFAFRTLTDDWRTIDGEVVRELIDLELLDVSVVAYPAYRETEVQVSKRAIDQVRALSTASAAPIVDGTSPAESSEAKAPEPSPVDATPVDAPTAEIQDAGGARSINLARLELAGRD